MQQGRRYGFILALLAVNVLAGVTLIFDAAQAASSNGPYYATPSWDQKLPAATRFVALADWNSEAVLDRETGLVWERSPAATSQTWPLALGACITKTVGGRKGWRLPAIPELASLLDPNVPSPDPTVPPIVPILPPGHPFLNIQLGVSSANYWSASSDANNSFVAWTVNFALGGVGSASKNGSFSSWCVRGGMQASEY